VKADRREAGYGSAGRPAEINDKGRLPALRGWVPFLLTAGVHDYARIARTAIRPVMPLRAPSRRVDGLACE
jgi:hypothetical protein